MCENEQNAIFELGIQLKSNQPSHELAAVQNEVIKSSKKCMQDLSNEATQHMVNFIKQ